MYVSLMFHCIDMPSSLVHSNISADFFHRILKLLKDKNLTVATLEESIKKEREDSSYKGVNLTFDDGWQSDYSVALPSLLKYGYKGDFFITTDWIGKKGYLTKEQLRELDKEGMKIGSHSHTHPFLATLDSKDIYEELKKSKEILEDILGHKTDSFSIPGGIYDKRVLDIAKEIGFEYICSSRPYLNNKEDLTNRFSIHSKSEFWEIERLFDFDKRYALKQKLFYDARRYAKVFIGHKNYEKFRDFVIH